MRIRTLGVAGFVCVLALLSAGVRAQDRLKSVPGYQKYQERRRGDFSRFFRMRPITWNADGRSVDFGRDDKHYRYDLTQRKLTETNGTPDTTPIPRARRRAGAGGQMPERGRQFTSAVSPDGKWKAVYRDRNLYLSHADGSSETPITTDGSEKTRLKYGTGSWVYGEELSQRTAIWWSPDSKHVAYYRFDESKVLDYFVTMHQVDTQDTLDTEPYPKAGAPNPIADILVYSLDAGKSITVDVRNGKPFTNDVMGHYVYAVQWTKDGSELLFNRTNRRQNIMELTAANPDTGACRVILREASPSSWTENRPDQQFLADGKRFIWASERTGYNNYYLYNLDGKLLATLTNHPYEVAGIEGVDEARGVLYYMARSGDNYYKRQLHRVRLDGTDDKRLTDPTLNHVVALSPEFSSFVDTAETHDKPPSMRLIDTQGTLISELLPPDAPLPAAQLGETFVYKAADGVTDCYGTLYKPSDFDPNKKYPLLVDVYAGPQSGGSGENYQGSPSITELGFLVASFDGRGTDGRGKAFKDALYLKVGIPEIDDQAAGVEFLKKRPYVDGSHVGIFGTSYGGYASLMCVLRHPESFQAASCASSPTDWRNYDTIYTERYMWIPQENGSGYDAGSAMHYVNSLHGRLMLYYGTADNNVHESNTLQLVKALQGAGKSFDLQVGPDFGHSGLNQDRMLEFFVDNLMPQQNGSAQLNR